MGTGRVVVASLAALLLGALPAVLAHGDDGMNMDTGDAPISPEMEPGNGPANYFRHPHYAAWMYAHASLMILGWILVMPVALVLSVARSRYHLPAQVLFHIVNGLGVFTGLVYNHATPDLYEHNSHHAIGWIVTSFTIVWTLMSTYVAYGEYKSKRQTPGGHDMTARAMAQHNSFHRYRDSLASRFSADSGQGTERNSASLFSSRRHSPDSENHKPEEPESPYPDERAENGEAEPEKQGLLGNNRIDRFISRNVRRFATPRASKVVRITQVVLEKCLLLLGFLGMLTGFVVYGGIFRDREVFSGLAHWIKGGIFFWYGLLTLGRWMGAFAEFGWAWNIRPQYPVVSRWKTRIPSAEFVESFVIWFYGASNVFLEHMNNWGKAWSAQDFEHVSITLLFFGGGLVGMMIESSWAQQMMNTTVELEKDKEEEMGGTSHFNLQSAAEEPDQLWKHPKTSKVSLNPFPGLVIMLLGIMMSSHHQNSMVSTMMHAQWGSLFCGFAMARAATYITLYIKPPTSHFASRPPSELITSFCLVSGGLMFMLSAHDTVRTIESNGVDAMAVFTVAMGLSGLILAWEIIVFSIKGWAIRKERAAVGKPLATL